MRFVPLVLTLNACTAAPVEATREPFPELSSERCIQPYGYVSLTVLRSAVVESEGGCCEELGSNGQLPRVGDTEEGEWYERFGSVCPDAGPMVSASWDADSCVLLYRISHSDVDGVFASESYRLSVAGQRLKGKADVFNTCFGKPDRKCRLRIDVTGTFERK